MVQCAYYVVCKKRDLNAKAKQTTQLHQDNSFFFQGKRSCPGWDLNLCYPHRASLKLGLDKAILHSVTTSQQQAAGVGPW